MLNKICSIGPVKSKSVKILTSNSVKENHIESGKLYNCYTKRNILLKEYMIRTIEVPS